MLTKLLFENLKGRGHSNTYARMGR